MSKINDALKQAGQTQSQGAPQAPRPAFDLAEPPPPAKDASNIVLTALIVVVMLISGILLVQWYRGGSGEMKVRARSSAPAASVTPAVSKPAVVSTTPVEAKPELPAVEVKAAAEAATDLAAAAEPAKPQPMTYKLQGIVFVPKNCSAVINGKTLYVGDRIGDVRVVRIEKDSVTLVTSAGRTNVMDLL